MPQRPKHSKKEWEALLSRVERNGWRVFRGKGYFQCYCPCSEKHRQSIPLTPSSSRSLKNKTAWLERQTCWKGQP